jgi:hypothetical protein
MVERTVGEVVKNKPTSWMGLKWAHQIAYVTNENSEQERKGHSFDLNN